MQTKLLVTTAVLLGLAAPAHAELFTIGATFNVDFGNSPTSENDTATFSPGVTQLLDGGNVDLTISVVAAGGGAEWAVFTYQTVSAGLPLSVSGQDWSINQVGIPAAVPLNFIADYSQWYGPNGANIPQTGGIFGQTLEASPVPGLTGSGEGSSGYVSPVGSGPLGNLGAFASPFDIVLNGLPATQVNGFTQALEFSAVTPSGAPEPSTWAMMFLGFAGLGLMGWRGSRKAAAQAA
jgi:hypothetical protein